VMITKPAAYRTKPRAMLAAWAQKGGTSELLTPRLLLVRKLGLFARDGLDEQFARKLFRASFQVNGKVLQLFVERIGALDEESFHGVLPFCLAHKETR